MDKDSDIDRAIIVSACLAGLNCRYNGKDRKDTEIVKLVEAGKAVPVCPEQLGGLSTPRAPAEIQQGEGEDVLEGRSRVLNRDALDVTENFLKGAKETLKIARMIKATKAILKSKSPSCGCGSIYDGTFTGHLRKGDGVTAALLKREGIKIESR